MSNLGRPSAYIFYGVTFDAREGINEDVLRVFDKKYRDMIGLDFMQINIAYHDDDLVKYGMIWKRSWIDQFDHVESGKLFDKEFDPPVLESIEIDEKIKMACKELGLPKKMPRWHLVSYEDR